MRPLEWCQKIASVNVFEVSSNVVMWRAVSGRGIILNSSNGFKVKTVVPYERIMLPRRFLTQHFHDIMLLVRVC